MSSNFALTITKLYVVLFCSIYFTSGSYIHLRDSLKKKRQVIDNCNKCQLPLYPPNTKYKIIGEEVQNYQFGNYVDQYSIIETICDEDYKLSQLTQKSSLCLNGAWVPSLTKCLRSCPSLSSVLSTNVKCKQGDVVLENCKNAIEGTTALLRCNPLYEKGSIDESPIHLCRNGKWEPSIVNCNPICGLKLSKSRDNIVNGQDTFQGEYPWQVGIYNSKKEFLCGGSVLNQRIILTAAHCLCNHVGDVQPIENYLIASGKYYRQYDDQRDTSAQYSKVLEIHVPERYKGILNFKADDIAVVILSDPFAITFSVRPVCIELNEESQHLDLSFNNEFVVLGWGFTSEGRNLSEVLKEIKVPYVPYNKCYEVVPKGFRKYITYDKICAGYINNGTSVCGGDSGGGLHLKKLYSDRYYIKGIVSNSPATSELQCDTNQYSTYTLVSKHIDFVRNLMVYHKTYESIECEQNDCKSEETEINLDNKDCKSVDDCNDVTTCQIPQHPSNGRLEIYHQENLQLLGPNDYAPLHSKLTTICNDGYVINTDILDSPTCADNQNWTSEPINCIAFKSSSNISIVVRNGKTAIITWIPPSKGSYNFRLAVLLLTPNQKELVIETSNSSHTLQNLMPGGTYQVQVFSIFEGKESAYGVQKFTTKPNSPGRFIVWNRKTTSMALLWQPPSPIGIYSGYKVSIEPSDPVESILFIDKGEDPTGPAQASFDGLVPGQNYNISIQTISDNELSIPISGNYRTLPLPPEDLAIDMELVTSTSFIVYCKEPNSQSKFDKYTISLGNGQNEELVMKLREEDTNWEFKGLEPGQTYQVIVKTTSGNVSSEPISTNVTLKPNQPGKLILWNRNTTSMALLWQPPSPTGIFSGYKLSIEPSHAVENILVINKEEDSDGPAEASFNGLVPGQQYHILIQTISGNQLSIPTNGYYRTLPLPPEEVTVNMKLVTSTSFIVNWEEPTGKCEFDKYTIALENGEKDMIITRLREEDKNWEFKDLEPGQTYQVVVKTVSGIVSSVPISTNVTLKPNQPGKLIIWNRNTTSMALLWQPPSPAGIFSGYKLSIEPSDAVESMLNINKEEDSDGPAQASFNGLVPGQNYHILIQTISGNQLSIPTNGYYRTLPLPPEKVTINMKLVTSTSFIVNWEEPTEKCEFDKYVIALKNREKEMLIMKLRKEDRKWKFENLEPGQTYVVVVKTVSDKVSSVPISTNVTLKPLPI